MTKKFFLLILIVGITSISFSLEKITLATMNWEPFYGEELPQNGFFSALSREAFKRAGYELEIKFLPWKRAISETQNGNFDGILGAYYSNERTEWGVYTEKIVDNEDVFFQKVENNINYENIEELKKFKIGVVRGDVPSEELKKMGFNVEEVNDYYQNILKLNLGRVDLALMSKKYFYNYVKYSENDLEGKMKPLEIPFKSYEVFNIITKKRSDAKVIVKKFNTALNEMKEDGTYEKIMSSFGQK